MTLLCIAIAGFSLTIRVKGVSLRKIYRTALRFTHLPSDGHLELFSRRQRAGREKIISRPRLWPVTDASDFTFTSYTTSWLSDEYWVIEFEVWLNVKFIRKYFDRAQLSQNKL
jgi:hypothetical protein